MAKDKWVTVQQYENNAHVQTPRVAKPARSGNASPRHSRSQEALFDQWMGENQPIKCVFHDGSFMIGRLVNYDTYAVSLLDNDSTEVLVFKQGIRMLVPV